MIPVAARRRAYGTSLGLRTFRLRMLKVRRKTYLRVGIAVLGPLRQIGLHLLMTINCRARLASKDDLYGGEVRYQDAVQCYVRGIYPCETPDWMKAGGVFTR